jgi:hypothetical protein
MGRPYTGAATVYSSPRLELSRLRKAGYFTKGAITSGSWNWSNGDKIKIVTNWTHAEAYMELIYTWTHPHTGENVDMRQRFDMVSKPSNLGKGTVLYFQCPRTGRLCRIIYRAYHARDFRSRWGFIYRLYYPSQTCAKLERWNERYWKAESELERTQGKRNPGKYRGKPTKRSLKRDRLFAELERTDEMRYSIAAWPKRLHGIFKDMANS